MDTSLYRAINRLAARTGWAHPLFIAYAKYGVLLFAVLLLAGWWLARSHTDIDAVAAVVWAGAGAVVALGVGQLIGHAVDRARPYAVMPTAHVLITRTSDFSFPSDHATAVGAVAAGLWLANRRLGLLAAGLGVVMAFARVYVGAHYPGDVAAGLVLGAVTVVALQPVARRVLRPVLARLAESPLRPLVAPRQA
jgi:membrane-associated phospholipid phosphatase